MRTMRTPFFAFAVLGAMIAVPGAAQERTYAVTVHRVQLHPATPATARRTMERIEAAALEACGASSFSLREMKLNEFGMSINGVKQSDEVFKKYKEKYSKFFDGDFSYSRDGVVRGQ